MSKTTRAVQTPGSDPALTQEPAAESNASTTEASTDAFQANGEILGKGTEEPLTDNAALQKQVAELAAMVRQLSAQRAPSNMPQKEELPAMAEIMKNPPTVPVLTVEGWFVPEKSAVTRA